MKYIDSLITAYSRMSKEGLGKAQAKHKRACAELKKRLDDHVLHLDVINWELINRRTEDAEENANNGGVLPL